MVEVYNLAGQNIVKPFGLNPAAISNGPMHNKVVSAFDREIFKLVNVTSSEVNRHPERKKFLFADLVKYLGFMVPIQAGAEAQYGHWEADWHRQTLVVGEGGFDGDGGAGDVVTFQLHEDSVFTDSGNGQTYTYARLRQIVHLNFGGTNIVNAWISAITPVAGPPATFEIELTPDDSNVDLLQLLTDAGAGEDYEITLTSNAYAEGSRQGATINTRNIRYSNQMQIIKDDAAVTGSHLNRAFYLEKVVLDDGKTEIYELRGTEEAELRMKYARDGAILVGTRNDNFFENDTDNVRAEFAGRPVWTTQGLVPFILQNGYKQPYTPGGFDVTDIDTVNDLLDAEAAPTDYITIHGSAFGREIRESLKDYLSNSVENQYTAMSMFGGGDVGKSLAVEVAFDSVRLQGSNRTLNFRNIDSFNDPKGLGTSSLPYKQMFFMLPFGTFKNTMPKSQRTEMFGSMYNSDKMPYWGYTYSSKRGYNREMEMWRTGAAGGEGQLIDKYTNDEDVLSCHFRGEFGAWNACGNLFLAGYPSGE